MTQHPAPLIVRTESNDDDAPFHGDKMGRKLIADQLTAYIDRLRAGAVVAVTAPWGEGKSWFGNNWYRQLKKSHRTAFIDAFKGDYLEDPFILIASELSGLLDKEHEDKPLMKKAIELGKVILPPIAKAVVNIIGGKVIENLDAANNEIREGLKSATEKAADHSAQWLEARFKDQACQAASMEGFKTALTEAAKKSEQPVVVFIDELDRCKPTFAVTLIERLKHFFDVHNVVFILLVNRSQLERSIEAYYGVGTDGHEYLKKFVNIWFTLPAPLSADLLGNQRIEEFVKHTLNGYKIDQTKSEAISHFTHDCTIWAAVFKMSLRDIEQMCTLFVLSGFERRTFGYYLMALKTMHPTTFDGIRRCDKAAHSEARTLLYQGLPNARNKYDEYPFSIINAVDEMHRLIVEDIKLQDLPILADMWEDLVSGYRDQHRAVSLLSEKIDLPLSAK